MILPTCNHQNRESYSKTLWCKRSKLQICENSGVDLGRSLEVLESDACRSDKGKDLVSLEIPDNLKMFKQNVNSEIIK